MDYREQARQAFLRATELLKDTDPSKLKYAALELRLALEALTYKRAEMYKAELSSVDLEKWQPRKLLELLLEIDPTADKSASISIGIEEEYGKPAKEMKFFGTDRVLSLAEIRKYYDRLGSYLHTPTAAQTAKGEIEALDKVRTRCVEVLEILKQVLSSKIFNADFKSFAKISCNRCEKEIVRRLPPKQDTLIAKCIHCPATYTVTVGESNDVRWQPRTHEVECGNSSCATRTTIWERELKLGSWWRCRGCGGKNTLGFGIDFVDASDSGNG